MPTLTPTQSILLARELLGDLPVDLEGRIDDTPARVQISGHGASVVTLRSAYVPLDPGSIVVAAAPGCRCEITLVVDTANAQRTSGTAHVLDLARLDAAGDRCSTVLVLDERALLA
jgi:hypothetical protein